MAWRSVKAFPAEALQASATGGVHESRARCRRLALVDEGGQPVGRVDDLVLDDRGRQVLGVTLERGWLRRRRQFVPLQDVRAIRRDHVVATPTPPPIAPPRPATGSLTGKVVVSRVGRYLGVVGDVYFDERTGEVSAYEIVQPWRPSAPDRTKIVPVEACPAIADVMVVFEISG